MASTTTLTIRVTRTVRFRGGRTIEKGSVLPARVSPFGDGYNVAHPSLIEGSWANVPTTHAEVVA